MMLRPNVIAEGGVTDLHGKVIFPNGTVFLMTGKKRMLAKGTPTATFDDILDYLAVYRIQSAMGTAQNPGPTSNAVKNALPVSNQKPMEEIFLNSMPVIAANSPGYLAARYAPLRTNTISAVKSHLGASKIFMTKGLKPAAGERNEIVYQFWVYIDNLTTYDLKSTNVGDTEYVFQLFETAPIDFGEELQNRIDMLNLGRAPKTIPISRAEIRQSFLSKYGMSNITKFQPGSLNSEEVQHILNDENYKEYFTNVFSQEIVGILPIIHNFYLTNNYFSDIRQAMRSTKNRVFDILNTTIDNHDSYNSNPDLSRSGARTVAISNSGLDPESLARDFILKMIIKTPIDIIKGLMELIDPHVAITKVIKTGTGAVFNLIQEQLNSVDLPSPGDNGISTAPFADGATGGDLFGSILCLIDYVLSHPPGFPPMPDFNLDGEPDDPPVAFFPRISEDGVDFLGTGMGMLMIPPTPLGLIYLLLSLINFDTQQPNLDVGVDFGPNQATAGAVDDAAGGACAEDLIIEPEEEEESEESLDAVRPPYVPGGS